MSNNNSLLLKQESKVLKEIKQEEQLDEEDRTLKTLQKEQKHTTEYSSSIELTRAEKLSCICARFKVNDPALREIDLSNFDIFSSDETDINGSSADHVTGEEKTRCDDDNKINRNTTTTSKTIISTTTSAAALSRNITKVVDDIVHKDEIMKARSASLQTSSDFLMMSFVSLLQEGARSNTLVTKISLRNSNLNDDFVIQFVDSLQDLAKTSRRRQFLKQIDFSQNEKLTDAVVFPILEAVLHHSTLTIVNLAGTQVSSENQDLIHSFSRLQKFPAAVKQLAWDIWTSPSYIKEGGKHSIIVDDDRNNHHENRSKTTTSSSSSYSSIPNIQFAVLYRDNNDPRAYTSDSVDVVVSLLEEAPDTLRTLRFDPDCVRGDASAERLAEFFRSCPSSLSLRELNVRNNSWTSFGLKIVLDAIEEMCLGTNNHNNNKHNLTVLDIGNNDIDDSAILHLARLSNSRLTNLTKVAIDGNSKISPAAAQELYRACSINVEGSRLRPALELIEREHDTMQEFYLRGGENGVSPMSNVGLRAIFTRMFETFKLKTTSTNTTTSPKHDDDANANDDDEGETTTRPSSILPQCALPCLERLIISNHNFGVEAVKLLTNLIKSHQTLTYVDISENKAIDDEAVHHLVRALNTNNSVVEINICGCNVSPRLQAQLKEACQLNREPHPLKSFVQLKTCDVTFTKLSLRNRKLLLMNANNSVTGGGMSTTSTTTTVKYTFDPLSKKQQIDAESFKWIREILAHQPQVTEVDFSGNDNIGEDPETFTELIELIRLCLPFSKLNIAFCHLKNFQAQKIATALYLNHNLSQIVANGNPQLYGESAELLRTSTTMNQLPSQFKSLYRYLSNGVRGITRICFEHTNNNNNNDNNNNSHGGQAQSDDFSSSTIGNEGAKILLSCLNKCPHVTHLTLSYQQLTDDLAPELERFLSAQTNLKEICLSHNSLGDNSALALAEVVGTHRETTCKPSPIHKNNNNKDDEQSSNNVDGFLNDTQNTPFNSSALNKINNSSSSSSSGGLISLDLSHNLIGDYGISEIIRGVQNHLFAPIPYSLRKVVINNNNSASDLPSAISALDLRLEWCLQPMEFQAMFARTLPLLLRSVMNHKKDMAKEEKRIKKQTEKETKERERVERKAAARAKKRLDHTLKKIFKRNAQQQKEERMRVKEMLENVEDEEGDEEKDEEDEQERRDEDILSRSSSISVRTNDDNKSDNEDDDATSTTNFTEDEDSKSVISSSSNPEEDDEETALSNTNNNSQQGDFLPFDTVMNLSLTTFEANTNPNSNKKKQKTSKTSMLKKTSSGETLDDNSNDNDEKHSVSSSQANTILSSHNTHATKGGGMTSHDSATQVIKKYSGYIWNEREMVFVGSAAAQLNEDSFRVLHGLMMEQKIHFRNQPSQIRAVRFPRHRFTVTQLEGIGRLIECLAHCRILDLNNCNFLDRKEEEEAELRRQQRMLEDSEAEKKIKEQLQLEQQRRMNAASLGEGDEQAKREEQQEAERKAKRKLEVLHDVVSSVANSAQQQKQSEHSAQRSRRLAVKEEKLALQLAKAQEKRALEEERYKKERGEVITKEAILALIDISVKNPQLRRVQLCSSSEAAKLVPEHDDHECNNNNNNNNGIVMDMNSNSENNNNSSTTSSIVSNYFEYFFDVIVDDLLWKQHCERSERKAKRKERINNNGSTNALMAMQGAESTEMASFEAIYADEEEGDLYSDYFDAMEHDEDNEEHAEEEEEYDAEKEEERNNESGGNLFDDNDKNNSNSRRKKHNHHQRKTADSSATSLNSSTYNNNDNNDKNNNLNNTQNSLDLSSTFTSTTLGGTSSPSQSLNNTISRGDDEHNNNSKDPKQQFKEEAMKKLKKKEQSIHQQKSDAKNKHHPSQTSAAASSIEYLKVPVTQSAELRMLELRLLSVLRANTLLPSSARQLWVRAAISHWHKEDQIYEQKVRDEAAAEAQKQKDQRHFIDSTTVKPGDADPYLYGASVASAILVGRGGGGGSEHHSSTSNNKTRKRSPIQQRSSLNNTNNIGASLSSPFESWKTLTLGSCSSASSSSSSVARLNNHNNNTTATPEIFTNLEAMTFFLNSICPIPISAKEIKQIVRQKYAHDQKIVKMKEQKEKEEAAEREEAREIEERQKRRRQEGIFLDSDQQFDGTSSTALSKPRGSFAAAGSSGVRFLTAASEERDRLLRKEQEKTPLKDFSDQLLVRYHNFVASLIAHQEELETQLVEQLAQAKKDLAALNERERQNLYGEERQKKMAAAAAKSVSRRRRRFSMSSSTAGAAEDGTGSSLATTATATPQARTPQVNTSLGSGATTAGSTSQQSSRVNRSVVKIIGENATTSTPNKSNKNPQNDNNQLDKNNLLSSSSSSIANQSLSAIHERLLDEITEQRTIQQDREDLQHRIKFLTQQLALCRFSLAAIKNRTHKMRKLHSVDCSKLKSMPDTCVVLLTCWLRCVAPQTIHALSLPFIQSATAREAVVILLESEQGQTIRRFSMAQNPDLLKQQHEEMMRANREQQEQQNQQQNQRTSQSPPSSSSTKFETLEEFALLKRINQLCDRNRKGLFSVGSTNSNNESSTMMNSPSLFANRFKSVRNYVLQAQTPPPPATSSSSTSNTAATTSSEQQNTSSMFSRNINNNNTQNYYYDDAHHRSILPATHQTPPPPSSSTKNNNNDKKLLQQQKLEFFQKKREHMIALLRTETADIDKDADEEQDDWTAATKLGGPFGLDDDKNAIRRREQKKKFIMKMKNTRGDIMDNVDDDDGDEKFSSSITTTTDTSGSAAPHEDNKYFVTRGRRYLATRDEYGQDPDNLSPRSLRKMLESEAAELEKMDQNKNNTNENDDNEKQDTAKQEL